MQSNGRSSPESIRFLGPPSSRPLPSFEYLLPKKFALDFFSGERLAAPVYLCHGMRCETTSDTRMEEPIHASSDGSCQNNSDLRVVLRKLIEFHGVDTVKRVLSSIEATNPSRSRGRPAGPAIDDWPSLKKAAAIWRQSGGGPVWPPLIAVGESLPGERESNARRLLTRLLTPGRACRDQFERAGIGDFQIAARKRKIQRADSEPGLAM
jgi:hypothetical protein